MITNSVKVKIVNVKGIGRKDTVATNFIYVGRGTPLGNPFRGNREAAVNKYKRWLWEKIKSKDADVLRELRRLYKIATGEKTLYLICHCAPKKCHGDVVKSCLEWIHKRRIQRCV